jgi:hypothetical protein
MYAYVVWCDVVQDGMPHLERWFLEMESSLVAWQCMRELPDVRSASFTWPDIRTAGVKGQSGVDEDGGRLATADERNRGLAQAVWWPLILQWRTGEADVVRESKQPGIETTFPSCKYCFLFFFPCSLSFSFPPSPCCCSAPTILLCVVRDQL